jgi:hypothetical protein
VQPQYLPGVLPLLFQRLTVADLMPNGTASGNSIIYMRESAVTNAAATVAEGGLKPASDINYAQVTETFKKIANTLKISDEMLQDVPYVQSQVNGRLVFFVQQKEEQQLLSGAGTGSELTGLLNRSGLTAAQAKSTDSAIDAIYKDITKIRVNAFVDPSAIVMHPTDWQGIRLSEGRQQPVLRGRPVHRRLRQRCGAVNDRSVLGNHGQPVGPAGGRHHVGHRRHRGRRRVQHLRRGVPQGRHHGGGDELQRERLPHQPHRDPR